jgi:large subunit ribosomal protein L6
MSRIGKRAIAVPSGITANVEGQTVKVKGPKGALSVALHDDVSVKLEGGQIKVEPRSETKRARSQWGTSRTLIANLITGVTKGFEQRLEINGVGYRAAVQGKNLQIALGYSHDIIYPIPEGITIATPRPVEIVISGSDRQKVGQVAAEIREYRPPEPYKGKGIKYSDERIFRKEGKQKYGRRAMTKLSDRFMRRQGRVRGALRLAAGERKRLSVYRSSKHIYAQLIDDDQGVTLASASSIEKTAREGLKTGARVDAAKAVGKLIAERAKEKGIEDVVFDRGGYLYHGRVKALAEAAREGGLKF